MKTALFIGTLSNAIAAALLISTIAAAAPPPVAAPPDSRAPDITYTEIKVAADKFWDWLDANHDGKIDGADRDARVLRRFAKLDTNHDGVMSKDEFLAAVHAREAKWHDHHPDGPGGAMPQDRPGPGHEGWGPEGGHHHGPGMRDGSWGMRRGGLVIMAIVRHALHDARSDGVVTRASFDAALKARFDKLDMNHDGSLSREELYAAMAHAWWQHRHGPNGWRRGDAAWPTKGQ